MRITAIGQCYFLQLLAQLMLLLLQTGDLFLLAKHGEVQRFQQVFHLGEFDFDFSQACVHHFFQ